jgi:vacuolar-type H+-ATPase subunit E/Vma4
MDILRTSDALESQILDEARARARRIRETADKECAALAAEADRAAREEAQKVEEGTAAEIAAVRHELASSLPLDFMRARLAFVQEAVEHALAEMFEAMPAAQRAGLIGKMLSRVAHAFTGTRLIVTASGVSAEEAKKVVAGNIPGAAVEAVRAAGSGPTAAAGMGIILETTDASRRFRGTLAELTSLLLEDHREELATALLGKDVSL